MNQIRLEPLVIFNTISICILYYHYNKKFITMSLDRDLLQIRCTDLNRQILELSKRIKFEVYRPKQIKTNELDHDSIIRSLNFK